MANHRNVFNDEQRAELRRGAIAAIYRVTRATTVVAADIAHEFFAADDAIHDLVSTQLKESPLSELFEERLSTQDLTSMVSQHRSAEQSLELVMLSAKLVRTHHPAAYKPYVTLVMAAAQSAADAVKEVSIPGYKRIIDAEDRALREIEQSLKGQEAATAMESNSPE